MIINKYAFVARAPPGPGGNLISASWIFVAAQQSAGKEGKEKEKTNGNCSFVQTFQPWLATSLYNHTT